MNWEKFEFWMLELTHNKRSLFHKALNCVIFWCFMFFLVVWFTVNYFKNLENCHGRNREITSTSRLRRILWLRTLVPSCKFWDCKEEDVVSYSCQKRKIYTRKQLKFFYMNYVVDLEVMVVQENLIRLWFMFSMFRSCLKYFLWFFYNKDMDIKDG